MLYGEPIIFMSFTQVIYNSIAEILNEWKDTKFILNIEIGRYYLKCFSKAGNDSEFSYTYVFVMRYCSKTTTS